MDFESDQSLKEWCKDKPLSILQLDPADRAVLRIADERDAIQKKTFTKWVNKHLNKTNRHVTDLFTDLQDGLNLISLLEVLTRELLPREKGKMRFHALQNVELVLNILRHKKIKLVNIRPEDIVDGNPKLTLGLIWTIILHFQISDIVVGEEPNVSAKDVLLRWAKKSTHRYPDVKVSDFTSSWRDGLAFNAIIHRNRPDLINWREVRQRTIRERLENAFYSAEKVGVTRLLDPEDVDTHEIDEKSIITYVSSLFDAFPDPPSVHPLYDNEAQRLTNEYREVASTLHMWIREKISFYSERTLPGTLNDLVRMVQECNKFRGMEVPQKQVSRQELARLYTDLQKIYESTGEVEIEPELHIDVLDRNWNKLMSLHAEREQQLQDEIKKFERLDRLADRLSRDCKRVDSRLDDVESRVKEEAKRLDRLHPMDAKRNADSIESEMRNIEESIQSMNQDLGTLKAVSHQSWPSLDKKVNKLHQKWVSLRSMLHQKLIARLASISFPVVEERTVTRQTRTVLETRLVDTNHHFRSLQQAIDWCNNKLKQLQENEYGNDLAGVKIELAHHQREHKEIDRFQQTVEQCAQAKNQFQGEEQSLYIQHLNTLHKVYSELLTTSNKRLSDLESLLDFLQSLQNQMGWLREKENVEIARDWSDPGINLQSVEQYHDSMMSELEKREVSVRSVIERGNALCLQGHPASKIISRWTELLKETWSCLLQFSIACEVHTLATRKYQEYMRDIREAEAWLQSRDELLSTVYSASEFSLDEGERLLKGMQELREELNGKAAQFAELASRAATVPPIKQRRLPITRPIQITAVCNYNSDNVIIEKDDTWLLHDNSALTHWRVSNLSNRTSDTNVPSVVFLIPPPGKEPLEAAERLNKAFERTTSLWQRKQTRLRQNMIFATIRVVRSWDLAQFIGMGPEQRSAIRRALNEDADKLLSEGDPSDPQLRRLRREMDEVNRLFDEFERRARLEDEQKVALREFTEHVSNLQSQLDEFERILNQRLIASITRDVHSLEHVVLQHKEFETDLKALTPQIDSLQPNYNALPRKTQALQVKMETILQQWNTLWNYSHLYVERLKCVEIVLASLDEAKNVVSELEVKLVSFGEMPTDLEPLRNVHDDLIRLQNAIAARQPVVDQLIDDATNVRRVVVRSRDRTSERDHHDLDRLDDEVNSVTRRWNDLCANLVERLRSCESAFSLLEGFGKTYQTEVKFIDESYTQLNELPPVSNAKHHIEPTKVLFTSIVERSQPLEQVNIDGGRFIREAKIYSVALRKYTERVAMLNPSFDASERTPCYPKIEEALDTLNTKYLTLVSVMQDRLRQLAALTGDKELQEYVAAIKPLELRTFRTVFSVSETAKQISNRWHENGTRDMGNQINGRVGREETGIGTAEIANETGLVDPVTGRELSVAEAIRLRILDVRSGTLNTKDGPVPLARAARMGLLEKRLSDKLLGPVPGGGNLLEAIQRELYAAETPSVSDYGLQDSINLNLISSDGQFLDRESGRYLSIDDAARARLLNADVHEIYDVDTKLTLRQALDRKFNIDLSKVQKPLSLKDAIDFAMYKNGEISSPIGTYNLNDAIEHHILETEHGTISDPRTNELITLKDALQSKIIVGDTYFGETSKSLESAASDGDLRTVSILSLFDIGLVRIEEDFKSLNWFVDKGLFHKGSFQIGTDSFLMEELENQNLLRREVKDIYCKKIGVKSSGKELNVYEAVSMGILDPKTGLLVNKKGRSVGFEEALRKKVITREGLTVLKSILAITLKTQTKTVRKWIAVEDTDEVDLEGRKWVSEEVRVVEKSKKSSVKRGVVNLLETLSTKKSKLSSMQNVSLRDAILKGVFDPIKGTLTSNKETHFKDCIDNGVINPDLGKVIDKKKSRELSFKKALEKKVMDDFGRIDGLTMEESINTGIIILDDSSPDPVQVAPGVIFDPSSSLVILTESGVSVRFAEAIKQGQLDPTKVRIDGLTIEEAIENELINEDLTEYNSSEGKVPVIEAIRKGYVAVDGKPLSSSGRDYSTLKSALTMAAVAPLAPLALGKLLIDAIKKDKPLTIDKNLTAKELALRGAYDSKMGKFAVGGRTANFNEVCDKIFDPDTVVKDLTTGEFIPLSAAKESLIDNDGNMVDHTTGRTVPFFQAVKMGWISSKKSSKPKPLFTILEAIEEEIINPTGSVTYEGEPTDLGGAVLDGILDPTEIAVKDRKDYIPLEQAVEIGLVDLNSNRMGTSTLTVSYQKGAVRPRIPPIALSAVIGRNEGLKDPLTQQPINLQESVNRLIVDPTISLILIDDEWIPLGSALSTNILPEEITSNLQKALNAGQIKTEMKPKNLIELVTERYYSPKTGKILDPRSGNYVTIKSGLISNLIDPDKTKFRDPKDDKILTFEQAEKELLDVEKGILLYPHKMSLDAAYRKGYLLPTLPPMTLPEAVLQGLSKNQGLELSGNLVGIQKGLDSGLIVDNQCLLYDNEIMAPSEAIEEGIMDPLSGEFRGLTLEKALLAGFLIPKKSFTLKEAVESGVYSPKSGLFTGGITAATAIRLGLLDPETTIVRTETGPEPFRSAVDTKTGRVATPKGELDFEQAFKKGILFDVPKPLALARAFDELYTNDRFLDPTTGRYLTLGEAVDEGLIDGSCIVKTATGPLSLTEAIERGLVNPSTAEMNGRKIKDIVETIVDKVAKDGVPLQFLIKSGLYTPETGKVYISGKEMTINRAIKDDKIDSDRICTVNPEGFSTLKEAICAKVVDPRAGKLVHENLALPLDVGMDLGLVQNLDELGLYEAVREGVDEIEKVNPELTRIKNNDRYIDLREAKKLGVVPQDLKAAIEAGIIVPSTNPVNLETACKSKLQVPQGFINPVNNEIVSLQKALEIGFINPKTTLLKNKPLDLALEEGLIAADGVKIAEGTLTFEEAFQRGLLVTVPETISQRASRLKVAFKAKSTLSDAIKSGFLDPKQSNVKNMGPLIKMIESGKIDPEAEGVVDSVEGSFTTPNFTVLQGVAVSFNDAIKTKRLDPESGIYANSDKKLTIREAVNAGILDPNTLVIKDTARRRFVKFPEAFKRGIVDERGNVLDRANSKLYNLKTGLEHDVVFVDKIPLIDALDYGSYNPTNGLFTDPFSPDTGINRRRVDLSAAIGSSLVNPDSAVIKNAAGSIKSVKEAISDGLLDPAQGRFRDEDEGESIDLIKAKTRGFIIPAASRQAMEEKYKVCDDVLNQLLDWISEVEIKLANQEPANEHLDGIRNQINLLKLIKEELDSQTRTITNCQDDVRTIVTTGAEYLARDEISHLEKTSKMLRSRYDLAQTTTDKLLRRLGAAADELNKFRSETHSFSDWLERAKQLATEKERSAGFRQSDASVAELMSDVISHQADLRFITMASQKFIDESKEFLKTVNEYRPHVSSRPTLVEPLSGSELRQLVQDLTREYKDLLNRVNNLSDRLSSLGGKTREYRAALDRVKHWMTSAEPACNKILSEPLAADPHSLDEQLSRAKVLNTEFSAQSRLFDTLRQTLDTLLRSIEGQASRSEINELVQPVEEVTTRYEHLHGALKSRIGALDNALEQSQGVESSLESVISWLSTAENNIKALTRPASLNKNRLDDQLRSLRAPLVDIQSHQGQVDAVAAQARQLVSQATNVRLAKRIDTKMKDMVSRYEKLLERATKLNESLIEVNSSLDYFNKTAQEIENWLGEASDGLSTGAPSTIDAIANERDTKREAIEQVLRDGRNLIGRKDVTDTSHVRDRIKNIETQWRDLNSLLDEKTRLSKLRAEQNLAYDKLRDQVIQWLNNFEGKIVRLEPIALHMDNIRRQTEELKPLVKEHRDFGPTIDKVFDLGSALDAFDRPESPTRRRSSVSPVKRLSSLGRRSSQELLSPSPTKLYASMTSPLSPVSSGFGSRRSSQEAFHLDDVTGVQQEMNEINNRYSTLGVRLSERSNELESTRDELKKALDHLKSLDSFIERTLRSLPRDTLPNSREEAEKMNKIVKGLLEEIYEKQSLLDNTKTSINELLVKKPNAPGSDSLKQQLNDVTAKWKNLSDVCKSRIQLLEDLKDLYDTHEHLGTWLSAKERMTAALGPISSDPRMVQSQVEQVQVLREELKATGPQLFHLEETTNHLVNKAKWTPLEGKLKTVKDRWAALAKKLDDRAANLGAAVDSTKEFDLGLSRLRDTLQNISDQIDTAQSEKDAEQHLRKLQACERQLEGARQLLADAEAAGEHLCQVLTDAASRADIQAKLASVNKQYNALQAKLDQRKAEVEGYLRDGREFDATVAKTLGWLSEELGSLTDRLLISADRDVLQQQVETHEPIYKDVLSKEHQIVMLLDRGISQQKSDKQSVRSLENLRNQWEKLKKEAVERQTRLATSMEHCRKYYKSLEAFIPWLTQAENKLDSLRPDSFSRRDLDKHLRDLASFRNDVWKKSGEFEHLRSLSETFVGSCDVDKEIVIQEISAAKARWDKLNNELLSRTSCLEELGRRIADASDRLRGLSHSVQRCEDRLGSHDSLATHTDAATLSRLAALRDEVLGLRKPLDSLRTTCTDLDDEIAHVSHGKTSDLSDDVNTLGERLDDLTARLDDRCDRAQVAAKAVQQYNEKVKLLMTDLNTLEDELSSMKPPGRDMKTLRSQQDQLSAFNSKLNRAGDDVSAMMSLADSLVDSGFSADATRQQAENVYKRLALIEAGSRRREEDLQEALDRLKDFIDKVDDANQLVSSALDEIKHLKPVGSEPETIRNQQEEAVKLRQDIIEPAGASVDTALSTGQVLAGTAAPGVSTAAIEKECEKLAERWASVKEKIVERERRLDAGLLQSGKFQEAVEGLLKWLSDTEEMVANQRPPSADYKVVKAQLQEQKFLKKMLLDRQGSMSSLVTMGREVAANCDAAERAGIERQLHSLAERFEDLSDKASTRMTALEQAFGVAKEFQDKLIPIVDWLDRTERKIKDMELVPTDEEKIQHKIKEHNALHDEILNKKGALSDLTEIASELAALVGDDEASVVADKVQEVADRYSSLAEASEGIATLLEAARGRLRHLVVTYQQLQAWMQSMENRLAKYKVLAVHTEQLLAQMEDLADLTEEISNQQGSIDSTVDAGLELMRNISADEAIQLKDKLDSLQRRYNELTTKGADLLKQTQEALPLVQQFHHAHNRLADWMHGAETTLQSAEPREESIQALEMDIQEFKPVLENINQLGPQLCAIGPGEGAATIEGLVTRDNRRFDSIAQQVQRKAERLRMCKQRSLEVLGDVDSLLEWFREVEAQLKEAEPPSSEPNIIRLQLKEHKALNDDIASQKGRVRDVLDTAKKVLRESPQYEDNSLMRDKMADLRETMDSVWAASGDRLSLLEQALALSQHFDSSHSELVSWLEERENEAKNLRPSMLRPQALIQDQVVTQRLLQSISEHKPLIDKLNKTGEALIKLVQYDEGQKVQEILDSDNQRYEALRNLLKARQEALEKALQESSEFSDKLEGMLRALTNAADEMSSAEPVSAHVPKIKQQLKENKSLVDEIAKREDAFEGIKKAAADVINKSPSDPAVKDIKRKMEKLQHLWNDVNAATKSRNKSLNEALEVAAKFWSQLEAVVAALAEIESSLVNQEPPALRPEEVQAQADQLDSINQDINQTKPHVDEVRKTGAKLMSLVGEPDKPEVRKNIEDLDNAWDTVTSLFAKRRENLIDAMERAMEFHDMLRSLKEFLKTAEARFSALGPLGEDINTIRTQMKEVKDLKAFLDPMMVKVESLNRQAAELTERSSAEQAQGLKEDLSKINGRWDELHRGIAERYRQLENALLRLGQFQQALSELLAWIAATDRTIDTEMYPIAVDPHQLEIQLAKLKVLLNDMTAHQTSVDTLNDAGRQIIEEGRGSDDSVQDKLNDLNTKWKALLSKATNRQTELEDALRQGHRFSAEVQDLLSWLGEVDSVIAASKPVGGLPETASEQLERFMVVYNELEDSRPRVEGVLSRGNEMLKKSTSDSSNHLAQSLKTLKTRWESVSARANDKKIKLEIALKEATEFHNALQNFVDWLTSAEKNLSNLKPVSRVLETILSQIEQHKSFQKEVGQHREAMVQLDRQGTHLKYFCQKQDVILIKNLLVSVQHRWERVVSKSAERTRALDHGYKEAKDYHDSWSNIMNWLGETDKKLDEVAAEISSVTNDPSKLKHKLAKHRETQKAIASKQGQYDTVMRNGKVLRDRAPKNDEPTLKNMASQLKELWNIVCAKAVERQRNLEEALLVCGQVKDALEGLLDWFRRTHKELNADALVHGDLDTVQMLIEQHKVLEQELESRTEQVKAVGKSGGELAMKGRLESELSNQIAELDSLCKGTVDLAQRRGVKLLGALRQAEELHKAVNMLLEWLSDAEMKLRFVDALPDDEAETRVQIKEHEKFMREMFDKEREKDSTLRLAEEILSKAHPDGASVVKHWITIIQSRWEEVTSWAKQRKELLDAQLRALMDMDSLLAELLAWTGEKESHLIALEHQELPSEVPPTQRLIEEHTIFMEDMTKRTSEIDTVIKAKTIKERKQSKKTSKDETRQSTQELSELSRRQSISLRSSKEHLSTLDRRSSRTSAAKDTVDSSLPHIGPKFPSKGSKTPEPQFKCTRSRMLYDRWRSVWLLSWERQRRLHDHLAHLNELERLANFSWDDWRKRFLKFNNHKKTRLTDLFRKMDKNNDGQIPRDDFIDGIIKTKFDTTKLEMGAVADMFDHQSEGYIDWKEFIAALRPDWEEKKPETEAEKIHDEVKRLVMLCTCRQKFRVFQVGEGKYRFGDSQKLRLVRILRSTVMVRVGGGWVALEEFLVKNDPCRAKGRTNIELREQFILADNVSQSMSAFKPKLSTERKTPTSNTGPITKVREKSNRSVPMTPGSRGSQSQSRGSMGSLSDVDTPLTGIATPRKSSLRTPSSLAPGGSLPGSRSNSRPASRTGSKPPSRHGSTLSLASSDDGTPSRIPRRSVPARTPTSTGTASASRKLTAPSALNGTPSPSARSSLSRASSIPTLVQNSGSKIPVYVGNTEYSSASSSGTPKSTSGRSTPKTSR